MVERYENVNLDVDVGPSPFERASSHGALPRTSSVEHTAPEGPVLSHSGELARRRLPGHKRASSLSDLSRCVAYILPCTPEATFVGAFICPLSANPKLAACREGGLSCFLEIFVQFSV
jgi:hypothetical protein